MSSSIKKFSKFIRIKILNRLQLLQYCRIRRDRQAVFFHETKERSMMKKYYSDCTLPPTAWYGMKWKTIFPFSSIPFPFHTKNLSFHIRFRTGNFLSYSIPYFHTKKLLDWKQCNYFVPLQCCKPGVPIFVDHWEGGQLAILPRLCPIFNIGGMNLDHDFFQESILSEDQNKKKCLHQNWKSFFSRIQVKTKKIKNKKVFTTISFFPRIQVKTKKKDLHQNWKSFFPRI